MGMKHIIISTISTLGVRIVVCWVLLGYLEIIQWLHIQVTVKLCEKSSRLKKKSSLRLHVPSIALNYLLNIGTNKLMFISATFLRTIIIILNLCEGYN